MCVRAFDFGISEEGGGKEWQIELKEEEKCVRKRLPKGRGRHGANFLCHIKCKREKKVLNKNIEHNCYEG